MNRYENLPPPNFISNRHHPPVPPPKKKKFDFMCLKNNACSSLNDVEHFLCDFNSFLKYMKLYNLLKRK